MEILGDYFDNENMKICMRFRNIFLKGFLIAEGVVTMFICLSAYILLIGSDSLDSYSRCSSKKFTVLTLDS